MKKTHLLWKILVVVMIISAMMATFIACGGHDCDKDGHIDENNDYWCDACNADMCPGHVDTDPRDHKCDVCGHDVDSCALEFHVDTNPADHVCDECGAIISDSEPWYNLIADLDNVIATLGMGDLATMGGSLKAGIDFVQGDAKRDIDLALDFGLQLEKFADEDINASSGNAFGFSIMDDGARIFGLWYVDNGSEADNYILGQFGKLGAEGTEVIKFNAPSLAETFNTYPINVDVNIDDKVEGVSLSSQAAMIAGAVASLLPLEEKTEGTTTTYSIALTNFLFNENLPKPINPHTIGSLLAGLAGSDDSNAIYKLLSVLGLETNLYTLLSDLLPGLTLDIAFTKDTNGNTTGAALGLGIAGEDGMKLDFYTGEDGTPSGVLTDIFSVEAAGKDHLVITNEFEDIDLDVSLSYEFGSNAFSVDSYPYAAKVATALETVEAEIAEEEVVPTEIGLLNIALGGTVTLGLNNVATTDYDVKIAIDLDPSALTKKGLTKSAYVTKTVDGVTKGVRVDGVVQKVPAINLDKSELVTAYELILTAVDNLYLKLGEIEIKLVDKTLDEDGIVNKFVVDLTNASGISELLTTFGVKLEGIAAQIVGSLQEGEMDLARQSSLGNTIRGLVLDMLSGFVLNNVQYSEPDGYFDETSEETPAGNNEAAAKETKAADSEVDAMGVIGQIADYIKMFKFDRDGDKVSVSIDNAKMNGAVIDFDATASALRGEDNKVNGLKLELGETGLVINGSDKVNTTIKLDKPLQIGGTGNLFSGLISAQVVDTRKIGSAENEEGETFYFVDNNGNGVYDEPKENDKGELVGDKIISESDAKSKNMTLTIGIDLDGIGYGVVPKVVNNSGQISGVIDGTKFNELFNNKNLAITAADVK